MTVGHGIMLVSVLVRHILQPLLVEYICSDDARTDSILTLKV